MLGGNRFHLTHSLKPRVEKKNLYLVQVVSYLGSSYSLNYGY